MKSSLLPSLLVHHLEYGTGYENVAVFSCASGIANYAEHTRRTETHCSFSFWIYSMKSKFFLSLTIVVAMASYSWGDIVATEYQGPVDTSGYIPPISPIGGDAYFITPGIGGAGGFAISMGGATDSVIDNAGEVVGADIVGGAPITSADLLIGNTLQISISDANGLLSPGGFTVGGLPADTAGLFIGGNAGGDPVDFTPHTVLAATIELFDVSGATLTGGPLDISSFSNFSNGPGGGWDGSLGVTFGAGSSGIGIARYELNVTFAKIPEPSTIAILSIATMGMISRRRR
jgi:hypothetical protein